MDEKLTSKIKRLPRNANYFSLEFFPPKTVTGAQNLQVRLERMARGLRPLFVNVTWGAGGSTASKTLELAECCQMLGLTTCMHLTCTNMSQKMIDDALEGAKAIGVRNILALRGDPPRDDSYQDNATQNQASFEYAVDLVRYIRKEYGDYFCIGVAAYPEGHGEGSHPERQDVMSDLPFLLEKVNAGAEFIMTQLFYDVDKYLSFEKLLRNHESAAFKDIVIIPGLMPVQSYQTLQRISKLSHVLLPSTLQAQFSSVKGDDDAVKALGVEALSDMINAIRAVESPVPRGFHFYTLNLEKVVATILEKCHLIPDLQHHDIETVVEETQDLTLSSSPPKNRTRRRSSVVQDPHNRVVVDQVRSIRQAGVSANAQEAGQSKLLNPQTQENNIAISEGEGSLGREATWDDYPNGRWGDARSPAYGEIDGYGVSLHMSPAQAIKLWSKPTTVDDISKLFVRNIEGSLDRLPWSEEGLRAESLTIQNQLSALNKRGWWTVASQPAVNAAKSDDKTFGWGPKGGYVFQKAFVEFFLSEDDWYKLKTTLKNSDVATYFAANAAGEYESNLVGDSLNAVTWGVFPGKEIISTTIIEEVSFKAWRNEAFAIWSEWQRIYPANSESAKLLSHIKTNYWLVNVIHHDYMDGDALWRDIFDIKL